MTASKLVLALLLVAFAQCHQIVSKEYWDNIVENIVKEDEDFVENNSQLKNAFTLVEGVWAAVAKYECAVEGDDCAKCRALKDDVALFSEEIAGVRPSKDEVHKLAAESDAGLDDVSELMAIHHAVLDYIGKKEPENAKALLAFSAMQEKEETLP